MMLSSVRASGLRLRSSEGSGRKRTPGCSSARRPTVAVRAMLELDQSAAAASTLWTVTHHVNQLASVAEDAVSAGTAAAAAVAAAGVGSAARTDSGPFDFLAEGFEKVLALLDSLLVKANVPYSYGFAIILLTVLVKLATFPLSQKQVMSTVAMQALAPRVKELQAKYANDTQTLQQETAKLYQEAGVNPLAGCLPTLATIPVFIGLYRALTLAAQDNLLNDPFFWIPSLGGPATLAMQQSGTGLSWLFPFVDGHPPIGWGTAGAYLVLPVLLVVSQYASQRLISPPSQDPAQAQTQAILQFLPLMIGWFSLNVPAGLTLYWFVNNILSTAQQLYLKNSAKSALPLTATASSSASSSTASSSTSTVFAPKEEKVKKISGKELNARRRKREDGEYVVDVEAEVLPPSSSSSLPGGASNGSEARSSRGKGDEFRAQKAREAAARAAAAATSAPPPSPPSPVASSNNGSPSAGNSGSGAQ
ncbi:inner membrane ALBINO3-like protein 2, chloroplast precursor [Haematococcus lacustris]